MKNSSTSENYNIESFKLNYRAIIPFYILLDPDLSKKELALYGLIEQMESCKGDVFYTNKNLAIILNVTDRAIRHMSERLKNKGYINRSLKLIKIGKRRVEMHCWNTVKGGVVSDCTGGEAGDPPLCNDNTGEEAVLPGGEEAVLPPCNTFKFNCSSSEEKPARDALPPPVTEALKHYEISEPVSVTRATQAYIESAINYLADNNYTIDIYLSYLYNKCSFILLPYEENGKQKRNGFSVIFKPSFMKRAINGDFEDRK